MAQKFKITVAYDGTDYFGWQRQPDKKTVQGTLEDVLYRFRSRRIPVIGAGRTDAGVHAQGQVAHFQADFGLEPPQLLRALNGQLPDDIRVTSLDKAPADFHARRSAVSKVYRYRIWNTASISPFYVRYVLHRPEALDVESMQAAAAEFIRRDDFSAFSSNREKNPVREVFQSEIARNGDEIAYTVAASGFLKYMVRTMVGSLLEIGRGRMISQDIDRLFRRKARTRECPTAPAKGLCLIRVDYPSRQS